MNNYLANSLLKRIGLIVACIVTLLLSSCATIIMGTKETITFNSDPPGAEIYVGGRPTGETTPATLKVKKNKVHHLSEKKKDLDGYVFKKENYNPYYLNKPEDLIDFNNKSGLWITLGLNLFTGLIPGMLVDMFTMAQNDLINNVSVKLQFTDEYLAKLEEQKRQEEMAREREELSKILEQGKGNPFKIISPKYGFLYLGKEGRNKLAQGTGNAISADGSFEIQNGVFDKGVLISGTMVDKNNNITYKGKFRNEDLVAGTIEGEFGIYTGNFSDGKINGKGTFRKGDTSYEGDFVNGLFEGLGKVANDTGEKFEGRFKNNMPHGDGIYFNGEQVERCEYYEGRRIDQAYLIRQENLRAETQREKERLEQAAFEKYQAEQQLQMEQQKSSNNLLKALVVGAVAYTVLKNVDVGSLLNSVDKIGAVAGGAAASGGNSSGPAVNCSLNDYRGPTADIQLASFCQGAYIYQCKGNAAGVKECCEKYAALRATTPNLPACPYCK